MAYKGIFKCKACQGSITASKVKKVQQNGNKHEYIYYHCGKSKDKNCEQRKFALNEKELEKQVLDLLEQITIPDNIYDIAIQELERSKKKTSQEQEEILNKYQKNLEREKAKIDNLIDLRTENEISKEEFARKRKTIEENIENYQNLIANLENSNKQANQAFEQVFKFATNLKDKFENGSPNEKKAIILNLGSNPETIDRKAHFYLDLRLQPFQKYSQGAIREIRQVQTSKNGLYYTKKAPLGAKNTLVCSVIDSFRTFNWAKALPIPDLVIKDARYLCGLIS